MLLFFGDASCTPWAFAVRTCNACFLKNVAWDSSRTFDVLGPADGKPVVLVHGALIGRQCLVLEARALADAGFRCALQQQQRVMQQCSSSCCCCDPAGTGCSAAPSANSLVNASCSTVAGLDAQRQQVAVFASKFAQWSCSCHPPLQQQIHVRPTFAPPEAVSESWLHTLAG